MSAAGGSVRTLSVRIGGFGDPSDSQRTRKPAIDTYDSSDGSLITCPGRKARRGGSRTPSQVKARGANTAVCDVAGAEYQDGRRFDFVGVTSVGSCKTASRYHYRNHADQRDRRCMFFGHTVPYLRPVSLPPAAERLSQTIRFPRRPKRVSGIHNTSLFLLTE